MIRTLASQPTPSTEAFERALAAYRQAWPRDGYYSSRMRFTETYELFRRFYVSGTVVDVGGWPGDFACTLASLGLSVAVIDKDPLRKTAKVSDGITGAFVLGGPSSLSDKCRQYGVRVFQCDIERERLPFADGDVEMLVCTEVVSHLRSGLLHVLRELHRVLARNGRLLVTTPNLLSLTNRLSFLLNRSEFEGITLPYDALAAEELIGHGGMFRLFSMRELTDLLVRTGFRVSYAGYRQLVTTGDEHLGWSPDSLRTGVRNAVARWFAPLGNALFVVAERAKP
jgi:SAM-dependent methyltransferase